MLGDPSTAGGSAPRETPLVVPDADAWADYFTFAELGELR